MLNGSIQQLTVLPTFASRELTPHRAESGSVQQLATVSTEASSQLAAYNKRQSSSSSYALCSVGTDDCLVMFLLLGY